MHPLINTNLQGISDKELQEKISMFMQKMVYCSKTNNMPMYNQLYMAYEMYMLESRERADRNQRTLEEAMREKKGLPKEEPTSKNITLD
jgi:hypothetical protein